MARNPFREDDEPMVQSTPAPERVAEAPAETPVEEEAPSAVQEETGSPATTPAEGGSPSDAEAPAEPSKRDKFRARVKERYPDLDMDDEDAYYDKMGGMMDDYESYETNTGKLRDALSTNEDLSEMLLAARDKEDFNPITWMIENRGVDIKSALDDPEFAEKFAKSEQIRKEKEAKGKEFFEEMQRNIGPTMEAQYKALEEAGITGEDADKAMEQIFDFADGISQGKWDPSFGVLLVKGGKYDSDVETAKEEGHAAGLSAKVDDKVRKLKDREEHVGGVQKPVTPEMPKQKKQRNPFLDD